MTESPCLSRFACDRLLNGELPNATAVRAHAGICRRCADRILEHVRERAVFAVPLRLPRRVPRWLSVSATVAAAAAAFVVAWAAARPAGEREKGKPSLGFYVQHAGSIRRGGPGDNVVAGDRLDFVVSTERAAFLALVGVDATGAVEIYYPQTASAAPIAAGREQLLPTGVALDAVLGVERIHAVFCDRPFAVERAKAFVAGASLPADCRVDVAWFEKR